MVRWLTEAAGTSDGAIVRIDGDAATEITNTGGRPLGIVVAPDGTLFVADARRGLLSVGEDGTTRVLVDSYRGERMLFVDDLDRRADGRIVFTDASQRFPIETYKLDLLEHRPTGRVFEYDPATMQTTLLASGLHFANGIALSRDGSYAVVCETGAYRLQKLELEGEARGRMSVLIEGLPGFCDNVRRDPSGDLFWVALPSPRDALLDWASPRPWVRSAVSRLPVAVQPGPKSLTAFVGISGRGEVLASVHDAGEGAYGPVTTAVAHGGQFYLGSLSATGFARLQRAPVVRTTP